MSLFIDFVTLESSN